MLSKNLMDAMNRHLSREFYAAYLYLSMSAYFESTALPGFSSWMQSQAKEEQGHAMKFFTFIYDRGGRVTLLALEQPPSEFKSPLDAFEQALAHEKQVTGDIDELYRVAVEEKDYASQAFLQWFVTEQVEEEKTASQIVDQLRLTGDSSAGLMLFDRELGSRGAPSG